MAKLKWQKFFTKDGMFIFTQTEMGLLLRISSLYTNDVAPFLRVIANDLREGSEAAALAGEVYDAALYIGYLIDEICNTKIADEEAKKLIQELSDNIDYVDTGVLKVEYMIKKEGATDDLRRIEKEQGKKLEDVKEVHKGSKESLEGVAPSKVKAAMSMLGEAGSEVGGLAKEASLGGLTAILGPFAGMAGIAGRAAWKLGKGISEKALENKKSKVSQSFARMSGGEPSDVIEEYERRQKGVNVGKIFKEGSIGDDNSDKRRTEDFKEKARERSYGDIRNDVRNVGGGSVGSAKSISDGMFVFFDKMWDKAKWTKDMHEAVIGKKAVAKEEKGGPFAGIADKIGNFFKNAIPFLLKSIAVAGAAMVGWSIGSWIREKFPVIDKFWMYIFGKMWTAWFKLTDFMANAWSKAVLPAFKAIGSFVGNVFNFLKNAFTGFIKFMMGSWTAIGKAVESVFGWMKPKDKKAKGDKSFNPSSAVAPWNQTAAEAAATEPAFATVEYDPNIKAQKSLLDELRSIGSSRDSKKDSGKNAPRTMSKQKNDYVYNLRDPLIEQLNSGSFALED